MKEIGKIILPVFLLLAALPQVSCDKGSGDILMIRIDASPAHLTLMCIDEFELTFRPTGSTQFSEVGEGTWAGGAVTYRTEEREGIRFFVIKASGDWVVNEITVNRLEKFPDQFVFEIPLRGIESAGSFEVRGYWKYKDVATAEAKHPLGTSLTLPDEDLLYTITCRRLTDDLCQSSTSDGEVAPEVIDFLDPSEDFYEDIPAGEDMEVVDAPDDLDDDSDLLVDPEPDIPPDPEDEADVESDILAED
ncbi:MAG: hypothetical protein ABIJ56_06990 [Pseudomonadota bacterium]